MGIPATEDNREWKIASPNKFKTCPDCQCRLVVGEVAAGHSMLPDIMGYICSGCEKQYVEVTILKDA